MCSDPYPWYIFLCVYARRTGDSSLWINLAICICGDLNRQPPFLANPSRHNCPNQTAPWKLGNHQTVSDLSYGMDPAFWLAWVCGSWILKTRDRPQYDTAHKSSLQSIKSKRWFQHVCWKTPVVQKGSERGSILQYVATLRILTPPTETPDPPSDTPGASKKVFLTPHDIPRILREAGILMNYPRITTSSMNHFESSTVITLSLDHL